MSKIYIVSEKVPPGFKMSIGAYVTKEQAFEQCKKLADERVENMKKSNTMIRKQYLKKVHEFAKKVEDGYEVRDGFIDGEQNVEDGRLDCKYDIVELEIGKNAKGKWNL